MPIPDREELQPSMIPFLLQRNVLKGMLVSLPSSLSGWDNLHVVLYLSLFDVPRVLAADNID